ncbi:MAG: AraC family transcriptional regulator [Eubacteriales bacterium]|nr:AraC family transcriptional regulator [Eubacteriales bacterium]
MNKKQIITSSTLEELKTHGKSGFPFQIYRENYDTYFMETMNLHWHRELEINIILHGTVIAQIDDKLYELHSGEGIFINSNVLHLTKAKFPEQHTEHLTVIFAPEFLAPAESAIYQEEIAPLLETPNFRGQPLHTDISWQTDILKEISQAAQSPLPTTPAPKLKIHTHLSNAWMILAEQLHCEESVPSLSHADLVTRERTRKMLSFIRDHYPDPLRIENIASSAQISRSECFRCFQKLVSQKPMEYLNNYRLTRAAELLKTTELSILEVGIQCGFSYQSYFGKKFMERYHMSPRKYRKHFYGVSSDPSS